MVVRLAELSRVPGRNARCDLVLMTHNNHIHFLLALFFAVFIGIRGAGGDLSGRGLCGSR